MNFTLNNLAKTSLNWLFPKKCIVCKKTLQKAHPCCDSCYEALPFQTHACHRCGQRLIANSDYCGRCINKPPFFDSCFCPFQYTGIIKNHIQSFKYYQKPELSHDLAHLLEFELQENTIQLPELIIPVPLHVRRLRYRGYNQSSLLANALSNTLDIPVAQNFIRKHKNTNSQVGLTSKKRQKNINHSFQIEKHYQAKSVAIIDDVVTSGATANEISKILKKNGVDYVQVWGIAHTT